MNKLRTWVLRQGIKYMLKKKGNEETACILLDSIAKNYDGKNNNFANTLEEVDDTLKDIPELQYCKDDLIRVTRNQRIKHGLVP